MKWKNVINITLLELLTTVRSTVAFAITLIMPFLMVLLMGNVMKDTFEAAEKEVIHNNLKLSSNTQMILTDVIQEFDTTLDEKAISNAITEANNHYGNFIEESIPKHSSPSNLTSYQFFSASMLVFFLLTSGMGLGCSLIDDRNNKTFKRIHSFSVKKNEYLMGKIIGNGLVGVFQGISIILITRFVFGVNWSKQYLGISIIVLLLILISSGIGIIFSKVLKTSGALTATLTIIFWFMAFISGGFTAIPISKFASRLTINHWAFNSLTTLITGGELKDIISHLIVLISMALILWIIGLALYNRRSSHE